MKNQIKKLQRNIAGTILPLAITLIAAIIPLAGLSVDIGYFGILRSSMEKATEAAAVAGAQEYFRNRADAGKAVNATVRAFKMNIADDTMVGNFYNATGPGQPSTLTFTKIFTQADGISSFYRETPITLTVMTTLDRGKISVTSALTPKPFFATFLADTAMISITKEAELPPLDVVFVVDLSGSMRFATVNTYVSTGFRKMIGEPGMGAPFNDIINSQSQSAPFSSSFIANGYQVTITNHNDIIVNTPSVDIPTNATYSTGKPIYINNADRGWIVNTANSIGLRRSALSGFRVSELMNLNISNEDRQLEVTIADNKLSNNLLDFTRFTNYFNRAANYIEPHSSAAYGVMAFIDTVRIYGAAALKIGLVTFESGSQTRDVSSNYLCYEFRADGVPKNMERKAPYLALSSPSEFNTIVDRLIIMTSSANGTALSPIKTYSYPNGGTNINAGLDNGKWTLDRSDRPGSEKIIILFTDGEPSHSFTALGQKVKSLTDAGVKIYSIVLTLAVTQNTIDQFKYQVETVGKAEPVIFINDPAKLKEGFLQIADELGLKLVN